MQVPKQLKKWSSLISDIYIDDGGGWNVGLKNGYICASSETHQVYEATLAEVVAVFKAKGVEPCSELNCPEWNTCKKFQIVKPAR